MSRINFIENFANKGLGWHKDTLIRALAFCLSPKAAAEALESMSLKNQVIRYAVLKKVIYDIESQGCQSYHITLASKLISSFDSLPINSKTTCGYFLDSLYSYLPFNNQEQIVSFFLTSRYVSLRNRAYKILQQDSIGDYESLVLQVWDKWHDYYCALLIIKYFKDDFITTHFNELQKVVEGKDETFRLYIRAGAIDLNLLTQLKIQDGITYAYVIFKLGKTLTNQQAVDIFNQFKFDSRVNLLIWCLGRMKIWHVLKDIALHSKQLSQDEIASLRKKYNLQQQKA